jgi:hypothetical protein
MKNQNVVTFNPLDKRHLAVSVGQAILRQPVITLKNLAIFDGAGIYAIYYTGNFNVYKPIAIRNQKNLFIAPIYVGKAVPKGSRKGGSLSISQGKDLYNRLNEHAQSIEEATNLDIMDFYCRYLIIDDIWIPLGESLLIAKFNPLWNKLIDGFGNHNPGSGRHAGLRPRWDVIHPGRSWANRCKPRNESAEQIMTEASDYLRNNPPPDNNDIISI